MKKTDVYVVVDTPKKANKLKGVLHMFGERTYSGSSIQDCLDNTENVLGFDKDENSFMSGYVNQFEYSRTEVSIKELRSILAKEHLKKGDVVVAGINGSDDNWLVKFESFTNYGDFLGYYTDLQSSYELTSHTGSFDNFIRYATEEEKALLEPKKELEIGKWYNSWNDTHNGYDLSYYTGTGCDYGFHSSDCWCSEQYWIKNTMPSEWKEATLQEVEKVLIKEAKRRGHNYKEYEYNTEENDLCGINNGRLESVFCDGHWEHPTSNFTDYDIGIVERLHDTLLDNHGYSLESKLLTDARLLANKIKSNIK